MTSRRCQTLLVLVLGASPAVGQLIPNGDFESGTLTGWTVGGTGQVQVLSATGVNPAIAPYQGTYFAMLSTGPGSRGGAGMSLDGRGGNND